MSSKASIQGRKVAARANEKGEGDAVMLRSGTRNLPGEKKPARKLGAAARYFLILEHVAASPEMVDILDLIANLGLPKATAYRLVDWLVLQGYLSREPRRRRLVIGAKLKSLAFRTLSSSMRNDSSHVVLRRLVHSVRETCNIGTLLNGEVVYLDRVEAEDWPLRLHYTTGSRVPMYCTAIGKLFLALGPQMRKGGVLDQLELRRFTRHTIIDRRELETELRAIRREQVSFDSEEYLDGVVCVAAPIMNGAGNLFAAIAIQAPAARMSVQTARKHLPALRAAAVELASLYEHD